MTPLCLLLNITACGLVYLSHKNQRYLIHPLSVHWQKLGGGILLLSLGLWSQYFSVVSALLLWLSCSMLTLSLLPILALGLKRSPK